MQLPKLLQMWQVISKGNEWRGRGRAVMYTEIRLETVRQQKMSFSRAAFNARQLTPHCTDIFLHSLDPLSQNVNLLLDCNELSVFAQA